MLRLLQKHCPVCGMDVEKETAVRRFGKYFCSEGHANQYAEIRMAQERTRDDSDRGTRGGCC